MHSAISLDPFNQQFNVSPHCISPTINCLGLLLSLLSSQFLTTRELPDRGSGRWQRSLLFCLWPSIRAQLRNQYLPYFQSSNANCLDQQRQQTLLLCSNFHQFPKQQQQNNNSRFIPWKNKCSNTTKHVFLLKMKYLNRQYKDMMSQIDLSH